MTPAAQAETLQKLAMLITTMAAAFAGITFEILVK